MNQQKIDLLKLDKYLLVCVIFKILGGKVTEDVCYKIRSPKSYCWFIL